MPPTHTDKGLRAAIAIRGDHPDVGVLVFSQCVETRYATRLLADRPTGVGYLLKDRVADVADFVDALTRVASGDADAPRARHAFADGRGKKASIASVFPVPGGRNAKTAFPRACGLEVIEEVAPEMGKSGTER